MSGLAFVAIVVLAPEPSRPGEGSAAEGLAQWYASHGGELVAGMLLIGLAYALFVTFVVSLAAPAGAADHSEPGVLVAVVAAGLVTSFQVLGQALAAAPALLGADFAPDAIATAAVMGSAGQEALVVVATFWRVLLLGAIGILAVRGRILAPWLGWLAAGLAGVSLIAPVTWIAAGKTELVGVLGFGSHLAFYGWVFLASALTAIRSLTIGRRRAAMAAVVILAACGGATASVQPATADRLVGTYACLQPGSSAPDVVVLAADGTLTMTHSDGFTEPTGNWSVEGDAGWFGRDGESAREVFTVEDGSLRFGDGTLCTPQ